jgi:uncharacterized protein YbaR (Trm112 family)
VAGPGCGSHPIRPTNFCKARRGTLADRPALLAALVRATDLYRRAAYSPHPISAAESSNGQAFVVQRPHVGIAVVARNSRAETSGLHSPCGRMRRTPGENRWSALICSKYCVARSTSAKKPGMLTLVKDSWLVCQDCGRKYPIRDDIPVMLIDEGTKWMNTAEADLPVPPPGE